MQKAMRLRQRVKLVSCWTGCKDKIDAKCASYTSSTNSIIKLPTLLAKAMVQHHYWNVKNLLIKKNNIQTLLVFLSHFTIVITTLFALIHFLVALSNNILNKSIIFTVLQFIYPTSTAMKSIVNVNISSLCEISIAIVLSSIMIFLVYIFLKSFKTTEIIQLAVQEKFQNVLNNSNYDNLNGIHYNLHLINSMKVRINVISYNKQQINLIAILLCGITKNRFEKENLNELEFKFKNKNVDRDNLLNDIFFTILDNGFDCHVVPPATLSIFQRLIVFSFNKKVLEYLKTMLSNVYLLLIIMEIREGNNTQTAADKEKRTCFRQHEHLISIFVKTISKKYNYNSKRRVFDSVDASIDVNKCYTLCNIVLCPPSFVLFYFYFIVVPCLFANNAKKKSSLV